nr:DUF2996 domain-containing protein [Neosynechococcus sphagnicola]
MEDKPFAEFIPQDYLPAIGKAFTALGISDLQLDFVNQTLPVRGLEKTESWQVVGSWARGQRQFNLYFLAADIQGQRAFSCTDNGTQASILEPFLGDERKVTLDLLVFGLMQRLNGQKWLARN